MSHTSIYGARPLAHLDGLLEILSTHPRKRVDAWRMMRTLCGVVGAREFIALVEAMKKTGRIHEVDGVLFLGKKGGKLNARSTKLISRGHGAG